MAISEDYAAVSINRTSISSGLGPTYVFKRIENEWIEEAILRPSDGVNGDAFGRGLALYGRDILVGAFNEDIGSNQEQGSVYYYVK